MKKLRLLTVLFALFAVCETWAQTSFTVVRLADVRSVYLDESSFRFTFSSCGTRAGGMMLPCAEHAVERSEFLAVLKRWLGKCGFNVVEDREQADGIVQGDLWIDDLAKRPSVFASKDPKNADRHAVYEPEWIVNAWMLNQDGERLWKLAGSGSYPGISYKASGLAKIEGKKLAKALEHDFKRAR